MRATHPPVPKCEADCKALHDAKRKAKRKKRLDNVEVCEWMKYPMNYKPISYKPIDIPGRHKHMKNKSILSSIYLHLSTHCHIPVTSIRQYIHINNTKESKHT